MSILSISNIIQKIHHKKKHHKGLISHKVVCGLSKPHFTPVECHRPSTKTLSACQVFQVLLLQFVYVIVLNPTHLRGR